MFNSKNMQKGQAFVGGILFAILLIGVVVFIFFMIKRPPSEEYKADIGGTGLSLSEVKKATEEIKSTEDKFPVAQVLPYGGPFDGTPFAIHKPRADGTILVEIDSTVDFEAAKTAALQWIQDQGYDTNKYNFTFKSSSFSY